MTIGRNSLVRYVVVDGTKFVLRVQANKHHGICDIILGTFETNKHKGFTPIRRMNELVSSFQGRQFDDEYVIDHLVNISYELLNK